MARTIVERIQAERSARKAAQEAVFGASVNPGRTAAPVTAGGEDFLSIFTREVIPVIGQTIAKEVGSSLDKVSLDLVTCLEQALARGSPPGARRPGRLAPVEEPVVEIERRDTDLDMPSEEVVREIDRVLSEFGPVESQPILQPEAFLLSTEGQETPPLVADCESDTGAGTETEAASVECEERETETLAFPARGGGEEPPAGAAGSPADHSPAGGAVSEPAGPPAAAAALPPSARILPELEAALASAVAGGISQFAVEVKRGQELIVNAIHRLRVRVAVLEEDLKRVAERLEETTSLLLREEQR